LRLCLTCIRIPPPHPLYPYTTLFRSRRVVEQHAATRAGCHGEVAEVEQAGKPAAAPRLVGEAAVERRTEVVVDHRPTARDAHARSEEHTSELQSRGQLVCRLLLEKKK